MRILFSIWILICGMKAMTQNDHWSLVPSVPAEDIYALLAHGDTLYAATDLVIYASRDAGESWMALPPLPAESGGVTALAVDGNWLYAGSTGRGLYRRPAAGGAWENLQNGLQVLGATYVKGILILGDTLLLGTEGGVYYRSSQAAAQVPWLGLNDGLSFNLSYSIHTLTHEEGVLFAGAGANGHLYRRELSGGPWVPVPITDPLIAGLTVYSFLALDDRLLASTSLGVFFSMDGGLHWQSAGTGLPPGHIAVIFRHRDRIVALTNHLAAGRVFYSTDRAATWQPFGLFPFTFMYGWQVAGDHMFLATQTGLYRATLDLITRTPAQDEPFTGNFLRAVFPNPATDQIRISLQLPRHMEVLITLCSAQGQTVRTIPPQRHAAGEHFLELQTGHLPAGAYWLVLDAEGRREVLPLQVVR